MVRRVVVLQPLVTLTACATTIWALYAGQTIRVRVRSHNTGMPRLIFAVSTKLILFREFLLHYFIASKTNVFFVLSSKRAANHFVHHESNVSRLLATIL